MVIDILFLQVMIRLRQIVLVVCTVEVMLVGGGGTGGGRLGGGGGAGGLSIVSGFEVHRSIKNWLLVQLRFIQISSDNTLQRGEPTIVLAPGPCEKACQRWWRSGHYGGSLQV